MKKSYSLFTIFKSVGIFFIASIILLSLISYHHQHIVEVLPPYPENTYLTGLGGAYLAFWLLFTFGYTAYLFPAYLTFLGLHMLGILRFYGLGKDKVINGISHVFFITFLSVLVGLFFTEKVMVARSAGIIGIYLSTFFRKYLGFYGSFILILFILIVNALLIFRFLSVDLFSWLKLILFALGRFLNKVGKKLGKVIKKLGKVIKRIGKWVLRRVKALVKAIRKIGKWIFRKVKVVGKVIKKIGKWIVRTVKEGDPKESTLVQEEKKDKEKKIKKVKIREEEKIRKVKEGVPKESTLVQEEKKDKEKKIKKVTPTIKFYTPQKGVEGVGPPSAAASVVKPKTDKDVPPKREEAEKEIKIGAQKKIVTPEEVQGPFDPGRYKLPSPRMLKVAFGADEGAVRGTIETNIKQLEETLAGFDVAAQVVNVQKGPVVTMYELKLVTGVKIQKISILSDDIALAMKSSQVRIVAPLPGRGTIGIEIPNEKKHFVYLREVIEERKFVTSSSKLTLAIGKDVSGSPVVADLKDMPHLLIAGTTGSGKTVCVHSLISSILFKSRPDQVKFVLIDPKMVELAPFDNIPHLICPLISNAKKATTVLGWVVKEMQRRYQVLSAVGVRNIEQYNVGRRCLPYIVIVVDELADLMVVAKEEMETAIQRLAQLSRAVGIHLILATQRPSVDVVTGVIKANFPARISFKVASRIDSRTVLDSAGGETLLGTGDLLFLKPGAVELTRAQASFIDDEDLRKLTSFVKTQGSPVYEPAIFEGEKQNAPEIAEQKALSEEKDELFEAAVKIVLQAGEASAAILKRELLIANARAESLLELMEKAKIVGPVSKESKERQILVDPKKFLKENNL